eukprot:Rhum_TRINITY_DN14321_c3_g1::Rhum_TRINITY_DN14321_c3_g1_i1::g.81377::m.81377
MFVQVAARLRRDHEGVHLALRVPAQKAVHAALVPARKQRDRRAVLLQPRAQPAVRKHPAGHRRQRDVDVAPPVPQRHRRAGQRHLQRRVRRRLVVQHARPQLRLRRQRRLRRVCVHRRRHAVPAVVLEQQVRRPQRRVQGVAQLAEGRRQQQAVQGLRVRRVRVEGQPEANLASVLGQRVGVDGVAAVAAPAQVVEAVGAHLRRLLDAALFPRRLQRDLDGLVEHSAGAHHLVHAVEQAQQHARVARTHDVAAADDGELAGEAEAAGGHADEGDAVGAVGAHVRQLALLDVDAHHVGHHLHLLAVEDTQHRTARGRQRHKRSSKHRAFAACFVLNEVQIL